MLLRPGLMRLSTEIGDTVNTAFLDMYDISVNSGTDDARAR